MAPQPVTLETLTTLIESTPPFDGLTPAMRQLLFEQALLVSYEADDIILAQGVIPAHHRYLYLVVSGAVQLVDLESGRMVDYCEEGDVFGQHALLQEGPLPYEARALQPTQCVLIPEAAFFRAYRSCEAFAAFFEKDLQRYTLRLSSTRIDVAGAQVLLTTPLRALVQRPPVGCTPQTTVQEAARRMREERIGSILVLGADGRALGILTNSDLRDKIVAEGSTPEMSVGQLMTTPLITLPAHAPVIEGLMTMARYRVHHLVLTESEAPDSPVVGVISGQDIAHVRGHDPVATLKRIEQADSPATLAVLRQEAFALLRQLRQQGMKASDLLHLNSTINDRIVARILKLIEAQQQPDEEWAIPWAWMALGSEGRQEMSFKTDQDNALIYADPYSDQRARWAEDWLGKLALQANAALEAVGFARCPADIMASNPHWRQSISSWKHTLRRWISYPDKKIEMQVSALLDLRAVYGAGELVEQLKVDLQQAVQERRGFLTFMMRHALRNRPPLSFLGRFVLDRSGEQRRGFDLKLRGLMPITDLARVLALEAGYVRSSGTLDRLHTAAAQLPQVRQIAQDLQEAYRFLVELQLDHQLQQIEAGKPPDHYIVPEQFTSGQRKMLKLVFSIIQKAQEALAAHYGASA